MMRARRHGDDGAATTRRARCRHDSTGRRLRSPAGLYCGVTARQGIGAGAMHATRCCWGAKHGSQERVSGHPPQDDPPPWHSRRWRLWTLDLVVGRHDTRRADRRFYGCPHCGVPSVPCAAALSGRVRWPAPAPSASPDARKPQIPSQAQSRRRADKIGVQGVPADEDGREGVAVGAAASTSPSSPAHDRGEQYGCMRATTARSL